MPTPASKPKSARPADASKRAFRCVAVIGKFRGQGLTQPLRELADFLAGLGVKVLLEAGTARQIRQRDYAPVSMDDIGRQADVAIVVGGDGTMLGVARQLAAYEVPLIGINQGRLGFMTDIALSRQLETLTPMMRGAYVSEQRSLLQARVERRVGKGKASKIKTIFEAIALNDVVVARGAVSGMIEISVEINGLYTYTQRADGLIIATPTGSTAYALSAHGPILHPGLQGLVLVPVAPQSLSNRPIVVPEDSEIVVTLDQLANSAPHPASASFDMQNLATLKEGDRIVVRRSPHKITFLHPADYNYFGVLRQKLNWTLMPVGAAQTTP
jgi:NAD+ kinase